MENTMSNVLNALKEQVRAGFAKPDNASLGTTAADIDHPTRIGDLLTQAEAARTELRHAGYGR